MLTLNTLKVKHVVLTILINVQGIDLPCTHCVLALAPAHAELRA